MRPWAAAAVVGPLLLSGVVGCVDRGEARTLRAREAAVTETAIASPGIFALGTGLNGDGAVSRDARSDHFVRGGEVFLSVDVSNATTNQMVGVIWRGPEGVVLHRETRHVAKSTRYAAFSSGATAHWPRGAYHAAVVIDGRVVSQLEFTIV